MSPSETTRHMGRAAPVLVKKRQCFVDRFYEVFADYLELFLGVPIKICRRPFAPIDYSTIVRSCIYWHWHFRSDESTWPDSSQAIPADRSFMGGPHARPRNGLRVRDQWNRATFNDSLNDSRSRCPAVSSDASMTINRFTAELIDVSVNQVNE